MFDYSRLDKEARKIAQEAAERIKTLSKRSSEDAVEMGRWLLKVREAMKAEQGFLAWVDQEFGMSRSTCYNRIHLAERPLIATLANRGVQLTVLIALARPSVPDEAIEDAVALAEKKTLSERDADEIIGRYRDEDRVEAEKAVAALEETGAEAHQEAEAGLDDEAEAAEAALKVRTEESEERYTTADIVERVRHCLDGIDLDPASCEAVQRTVKAKRHFTTEDGLGRSWKGKVFLHPPFSRTQHFLQKLGEEIAAGRCTSAVAVVQAGILACIGSPWFRPLLEGAICVPFARGGVVILYCGPHPQEFVERFEELGTVLGRIGGPAADIVPLDSGKRRTA